MLAYGVGNAFRFHFTGTAVNTVLPVHRRGKVNIVQFCVGDFVNGGFNGL